jgi:hypothetical protein
MRGKILKAILIIAILSLPVNVSASGTQAADFLNIDVSAMQASFGGAGSALSNDISASYYNPAGLSMVERSGINFMHNLWYQDISYEFLGGAIPIGDKQTIGVSAAYLHMGQIQSFDAFNQSNGSFRAYSLVGSASYSYNVTGRLSVGLSGKYITEKLADIEASGYAFDIGTQYYLDIFSFGVVLNNLGPKIKYESESFSLPAAVSFGAAYEPFILPVKVLAGARVPVEGKTSFSTGVEYNLSNFLSLRSGVGGLGGENQSNAFNFGAGFKVAGIDIDYAFNPGGDLGQTHFFSFTMSFGKSRQISFDHVNLIEPATQPQVRKEQPAPGDEIAPPDQSIYIVSAGKFASRQMAKFHVETLKDFGVKSVAEAQPDGSFRVTLVKTGDQQKAQKLFNELSAKGIAVVIETH